MLNDITISEYVKVEERLEIIISDDDGLEVSEGMY